MEGKVEICESTVKTNGKMETIQEISNDNQNAEIDVRQRRDFLKKYGKESRHNVISRKDNLVLSPDQPPRIEEDNEVKFELPTKFHNYIKVVHIKITIKATIFILKNCSIYISFSMIFSLFCNNSISILENFIGLWKCKGNYRKCVYTKKICETNIRSIGGII